MISPILTILFFSFAYKLLIMETAPAPTKKELFTALVNQKGWEGAGVMVNIAGEGLVVFGVKYEEAKGKYVAEYFGGKVEPEDADPRETALRELEEETGLVVGRDDLMGPVVTSKGDFGRVELYEIFITMEEYRLLQKNVKPDYDFEFYCSLSRKFLLSKKESNFEDLGMVHPDDGKPIDIRKFNRYLLQLL